MMAARPHTLPAAAAPVIVGTGLAVEEGVFAPLPAVAALVGAALIQIGTNLANDYYDAIKGADTDEREGFTRVTSSGLIAPGEVKRATYATFGLALLVGVYLVYVGGLPILVVGLVSIASGLAYTAGPFPLGYNALGDAFVFLFFGVVAVTGTFYVQAAAVADGVLTVSLNLPGGVSLLPAVVASLPVAAISTNVLVVNNVRDLETDRKAGKTTLAVLLGYTGSRIQFVGLLVLAYGVPAWFFLTAGYGPTVLLPLLTVPYAAVVTRTMLERTDGEALNPALERTGKLLAGYAALFGVGLVLA
jgi:1,4-dihydroxy-2-naphthoate octaprenyltransferase